MHSRGPPVGAVQASTVPLAPLDSIDPWLERPANAASISRTMDVAAYQFGIYPRSEAVVAATRALERGRADEGQVEAAYRADRDAFVAAQRDAGLDFISDGLLRWQDLFRPLVHLS